jgi:phosphoribosylaminoimidazolecarboxamide formyltransferase/IMP cyclohydrolase
MSTVDEQSKGSVGEQSPPAGLSKIRRAIISVSDKNGLVEFARGLETHGVEIISTGGTMAALKEAGVKVTGISTFTGSPEILDGRVKTLHPKVHSGILFRRDLQEHVDALAAHEYKPIDMVVVNLYPFEQTLANPDSTPEQIVENIDIGGPSLIRAAAKNFEGVAVVTNSEQYKPALDEMNATDGCVSLQSRESFAAAAFIMTGIYDNHIADYFAKRISSETGSGGESLTFKFKEKSTLRYGENPHQTAKFYSRDGATGPSLTDAEILSGKELSFNNIADMDAALESAFRIWFDYRFESHSGYGRGGETARDAIC